MPEKEISEQEKDKVVSKSETSVKINPEINLQKDEISQNDEQDLLYTHKPENRGSSMQWNSAFCRKPGH